jgi:exonuclease SbcC
MELQGIRLKGFKGIKHGLGVDQIELDLSGINGLIALTGANGAGKTTLMEQMQPFPQVVSRPNPALKNHVYLRDSEKDLSFRLNGHDYRSLVKIDAQSGRAEGYLWQDGQPMVDGKITSFTKAIEGLFGSPELFFSSVFAAQGAAKVSDLKPAEFKRLMGEFLRLDRYFEWEKTAKEAEARITRAITGLDRGIERGFQSLASFEDPAARRKAATNKLENLQHQKGWTDRMIEVVQSDIDEAKTRAAEANAIVATLETERHRLADINQRIETQKVVGGQKIRDAENAAKDAAAAVGALKNILLSAEKIETAANELKQSRADLSELEMEREKCLQGVRAADLAIENLRASKSREIERLEKVLEGLRSVFDDRQRRKNELERAVDRIANARGALVASSQLVRLESEIKSLDRQAKDLERRGTVSCTACNTGFACNSHDCAFIQSALTAAETLPAKIAERDAEAQRIKIEGEKLLVEQKANDADLADAKRLLAENITAGKETKASLSGAKDRLAAELQDAESSRRTIQADVDALSAKIADRRAIIADLEALAAKIDEIMAANHRLPEAHAALSAAQNRMETVNAEVDELLNGLYRDRSSAQTIVTDLEARIDQGIDIEIAALTEKLEGHKKSLRKIDEAISETRADLATIEADAKRVAEINDEIETLVYRRGKLVVDASEWAYLKNATGANGLRALEIDATAPLISRYANDLLSATYGPAHSLELRTQDDEGREVLLPVVTRSDGSSEIIGQFSGGEKTWDLKALRLALTLVAKQKSGRDFQTAFADEEDGALDLEAAKAFIAMYREFLRLGGFGSIFFISHKPECVGLADHRIVFNGGIHVE